MTQYDDIVIGAGHNGLVCANYLARAGRKVLVLEASEKIGGLASQYEFHPGFNTSVAQSINHFSEQIASELDLKKHGCDLSNKALTDTLLKQNAEHITLVGDKLTGVDNNEQQRFRRYRQLMQSFANVLASFWLKTIPRIGQPGIKQNLTYALLGLKLRLLGKKDMSEFMRVATLPTRDLMDENFDDEQLKVLLSWDALIGNQMAPRSPNGSVMTMLYRMAGKSAGKHMLPKQAGIGSLVNSLKLSAEAAGVEIKTNTAVANIIVSGDENGQKTNGVILSSGEAIESANVISAVDPKSTFLCLVGAHHLDIEFTNRISRLRTDGMVAKLNLALDGIPDFKGISQPDGRMIIAETQDTLEFSYDNAKYGEIPEQPVLEILIPSIHDKSLAPDGKHVLTAQVMYVPYRHKEGWSDEHKQALYEKVINLLEAYAPDIRQLIIHGELLTPADIERQFNVSGGHWHHGELSLWQMLMMRPTYEAAQYKTPIPGLYLCSAGSHPGGGLTGAPGHNAAKEILKVVQS